MSQNIRVLQCFDCKLYQVDIVKKAKRWQCKVCGVKQSFRTEYFRGTGADCRAKVQELNKLRGLEVQKQSNDVLQLLTDDDFQREKINLVSKKAALPMTDTASEKGSKWLDYVEAVDNKALSKENAGGIDERNDETVFAFVSKPKWTKNSSGNIECSSIKRKHTEYPQIEESNKKPSKWGAFI